METYTANTQMPTTHVPITLIPRFHMREKGRERRGKKIEGVGPTVSHDATLTFNDHLNIV